MKETRDADPDHMMFSDGDISVPPGAITALDRENWRVVAQAQAQKAFSRGEKAFHSGDLETALCFLERAHRLAPNASDISLLLAAVRCGCGFQKEAIPLLEGLLERNESLQIRLLLSGAFLACRQINEAETALSEILGRYICTNDVVLLADQISHLTGRGWCGIAEGEAVICGGGVRAPIMRDVSGKRLRAVLENGRFHLDSDTVRSGDVHVSDGTDALLGSPLQFCFPRRSEGFVEATPDGGIKGWIRYPYDSARVPTIMLCDARTGNILTTLECNEVLHGGSSVLASDGLRIFHVPYSSLPDIELRVLGLDGVDLRGSPIDPGLEQRAARWVSTYLSGGGTGKNENIPAFLSVSVSPELPPRRRNTVRKFSGVLIVVPVFKDVGATEACLQSLCKTIFGSRKGGRKKIFSIEILVVDDASPDVLMCEMLAGFEARGFVRVLRLAENLGFPGAVNVGLEQAGDRDVVLLNSDTYVTEGWLAGLLRVAEAAPDHGTVTPFSNDATILSYPGLTGNAVPDHRLADEFSVFMSEANGNSYIEIPTAHGFCMLIRNDCLREVGYLREDVFAQGYGEENDFCMRARMQGWRHVAATGVFVAHLGSGSFGRGMAATALLERNVGILNRLHPGYDQLIRAFCDRDPLFGARRRIDLLRWKKRRSQARKTILLIAHDQGGGVERAVQERVVALRRVHVDVVVVVPVSNGCRVVAGGDKLRTGGNFPNLRWRIPEEWSDFLLFLQNENFISVEVHHYTGHHVLIRQLADHLGLPIDFRLHDYAAFCPRVSLTGPAGHYCGEPDLPGCERCVREAGARTSFSGTVARYVARSDKELRAARSVTVPSMDMSRRIQRHFPGLKAIVEPLENDRPDLSLSEFSRDCLADRRPAAEVGIPRRHRWRVCVIGALGPEKGLDILHAMAQDAEARSLPLEFVIVGYTSDDEKLMKTGHVFMTGPYSEGEVEDIVRVQKADMAFLPSVWPETWSFTLGAAWRSGLNVAAFDMGAPAERIRMTGRGYLFPPGLPAGELNLILQRLCVGSCGPDSRTA
mgnify:CR=1 FL=1